MRQMLANCSRRIRTVAWKNEKTRQFVINDFTTVMHLFNDAGTDVQSGRGWTNQLQAIHNGSKPKSQLKVKTMSSINPAKMKRKAERPRSRSSDGEGERELALEGEP